MALNEILRMHFFFTFPQSSSTILFLPVLLLQKDCAEFALHCGWYPLTGGARACWQDTAVSQVGMHQQDLHSAVATESECSIFGQHSTLFLFFRLGVCRQTDRLCETPFWLRLTLDFLFGFASYSCLLLLWLRNSLCRPCSSDCQNLSKTTQNHSILESCFANACRPIQGRTPKVETSEHGCAGSYPSTWQIWSGWHARWRRSSESNLT